MYEENEISIKEIILIFINNRKLIAVITSFFTIAAVIVTLSFPKSYETQSQIVFNLPISNESRFGTYYFPSQNITDYLTLLSSGEVRNEVALELKIPSSKVIPQVEFNKENKFVIVKTVASTPELAKQINDVLVNTYIKRIRAQFKVEAINKFINYELNSIKNESYQVDITRSMIDQKSLLLSEIKPVYILQKAIFSDAESASLYANKNNVDFNGLSNNVILEEFANEKYLQIQAEIIDLRSSLINISESIKFSEKILIELNEKKEKTVKEIQALNYESILNDELDVLNGSIVQVSEAIVPSSEVSPRKIMLISSGFIFGFLASLITVLFRNYWATTID